MKIHEYQAKELFRKSGVTVLRGKVAATAAEAAAGFKELNSPLAVVKAQVDFIRGKVPEADVVLHPYSGEAGAIGAALCAADWRESAGARASRFRGFEAIAALTYTSTTAADTVCKWCEVNCQRTFIDVEIEGAQGRPWSKVPLAAGWQRVIVNNSCPRGQIEDAREVKAVKDEIDRLKHEFPNSAQLVQKSAFRAARVEVE